MLEIDGIEKADPKADHIRRRMSLMRLFHWHNQCVAEHEAAKEASRRVSHGRGKDSRNNTIDDLLGQFCPNWRQIRDDERKSRRNIHANKSIGKIWCHLVNFLRCGVALICGTEMDFEAGCVSRPSQMQRQNFTQHLDYRSLPLDSELEEIRLIQLLPGQYGDSIECKLERSPLNSCPTYETISYVWGDATKTVPITCNGSRLDITTNLFAALNQFRDENIPRILWADAICINQADPDERKKQVLIMRKIYGKSERTLIWLGTSDEHTRNAIMLLRTLIKVRKRLEINSYSRNWLEMNRKGQCVYGLPQSFDSTCRSISAFLCRDWFTRVWIIQELVVSKMAIIICGSFEISWTDFCTAISHATNYFIPHICPTALMRVQQLECFRLAGRTQSLLNLLFLPRAFHATDPRDKVYALCGLANDCGPDALDIEPDYNLGVEHLYWKVAQRVLLKSSCLDILSVPRVVQTSKLGHVPTWVPDWTVSNSITSMVFPILSGNSPFNFNAISGDTSYSVQFSDNGSSICLSGHFLGRIEEVGEVHTYEAEDIALTSFLKKLWLVPNEQALFNNWEQIYRARSGITYPATGENILDAYWQTLGAGGTLGRYAVEKQAFEQWDEKIRSPFRQLPTSKFLKWTLPVLAIPAFVEMVWNVLNYDLIDQIRTIRKTTAVAQRRLFKTEKGYIGLAPSMARKGDGIALLNGSKVPLILRAAPESAHWTLIGDCYVHGIMQGEGFSKQKCHNIWIR